MQAQAYTQGKESKLVTCTHTTGTLSPHPHTHTHMYTVSTRPKRKL